MKADSARTIIADLNDAHAHDLIVGGLAVVAHGFMRYTVDVDMNSSEQLNPSNGDWHCGGWESARRETYCHMQSLTFDQKLGWLEGAQQLIA